MPERIMYASVLQGALVSRPFYATNRLLTSEAFENDRTKEKSESDSWVIQIDHKRTSKHAGKLLVALSHKFKRQLGLFPIRKGHYSRALYEKYEMNYRICAKETTLSFHHKNRIKTM